MQRGLQRWARWLVLALAFTLAGCGGGSGGGGDTPPVAVIQATAQALSVSPVTLQVTLGSEVTLDGSGSTVSGARTGYAWTLTSRPASSAAALDPAQLASARTGFVPDIAGSYVVALDVTDEQGRTSRQTATLVAIQGAPVVTLTGTVEFKGLADTRPAQTLAVGSMVSLDTAGTTDPNGGAVAVGWQMLQQPAGSKATLTTSGTITYFTADMAGAYQVRARGTNVAGQFSDVVFVYNATAQAPVVAVAASVTAVGGSSTLDAAVGNLVLLDTSDSAVPSFATTSTAWQLLSRPTGSTAVLSATSGSLVSLVPDVAGTYLVRTTLLDSATGVSSQFTTTLDVIPGVTAVVTGYTLPVVRVSAPPLVSGAGLPVMLRGSSSYDPNGGALAYRWSINYKPFGSTTTLAQTTQADITITPDLDGAYQFQLEVTDSAGRTSTQAVTVYVGNYPPVAALDRTQVAVLVGQSVTASAAASISQSGKPLGFQWSVDARPAGSTATVATPTSASLSFTPDVAGTYYLTVTVTEGGVTSIAGLTLTATVPVPGTVELPYTPLMAAYSKSLGLAAIVSSTPNVLHLVDPAAATDTAIALPTAVKGLNLSPDGRLAAVLHEGTVSLIDLPTATLLHSSATGGSQTEALVSDAGLVYLTGQTGGQWVYPAFTVLDGRTGATVQTHSGFASVYGTTRAILAGGAGKLFTLSLGLSPSQIYGTTVDPVTGLLGVGQGSPYWGDYAVGAPFWLSADQTLLFTSAGTYFRTSDLTYAGTLGSAVVSVSHSATAQEAVALSTSSTLWSTTVVYPSVYKRYTGSLLFPQADTPLPTVYGATAYGRQIFHAADDKLVMLVQTGSAQSDASGLQFYLLKR
ncbi:PKD domain-containing protein [Sphaerotilus sp.]|uniref:PKD domain-containing protein n=1 Tax=Sphaerotilus sp. TaxID=2093942 RepID=UPI002ACEC571|nr:hypothetical protein [Sphaerotilus sp.]MDZ7857280.1 hypothetical protein [Sphaerotilus sp.]